jgi:hypothetical protein
VERGCAPINHVPFKGGTEPLGKGRRLIALGHWDSWGSAWTDISERHRLDPVR